MTREYAALSVACPECRAVEGRPCVRPDGSELAGVHRRRDLAYNRVEWESVALAAREDVRDA